MYRTIFRAMNLERAYQPQRAEWVQVAALAAGLGASLPGGASSASAARKADRLRREQDAKNEALYNRRYNESYIDSAAGRNAIRQATDYAKEIGPCRTFVFFHEIEYLFQNNLVKGGDVDNAIVIVEHPGQPEEVERLSALFNVPELAINDNGYLNNLKLHFPNECGRHKLLDLIGDMRLAGGYLKAKVTAFKPGHTINTRTAKAIREKSC